jgi:hypothetical protein
MKHINPENQWKSIKYNEQHLKKWKCNEHLWRKDHEHVEVKTNKNIQQNNVNGWQNLENYRKNKKHNENMKTRRDNVEKKQRKNNTKHWKKWRHNNEPYTVLNNETHEKNQEKTNEK